MTENLCWSVWSILDLSYLLHITPVLCPLVPLLVSLSVWEWPVTTLWILLLLHRFWLYCFSCTDLYFVDLHIFMLCPCPYILCFTFIRSSLCEVCLSLTFWVYCDELSIFIVLEITGQILKTPLMIQWSPNIENLWWSHNCDDDHCIADW